MPNFPSQRIFLILFLGKNLKENKIVRIKIIAAFSKIVVVVRLGSFRQQGVDSFLIVVLRRNDVIDFKIHTFDSIRIDPPS